MSEIKVDLCIKITQISFNPVLKAFEKFGPDICKNLCMLIMKRDRKTRTRARKGIEKQELDVQTNFAVKGSLMEDRSE